MPAELVWPGIPPSQNLGGFCVCPVQAVCTAYHDLSAKETFHCFGFQIFYLLSIFQVVK